MIFKSKIVPEKLNNTRIDNLLKDLKLVDSRNKALAMIISGNVFVNDIKIDKPGKLIKSNSVIKLRQNDHQWVSRGGVKLDHSIKVLNVDVKNKVCLDIGSSTGGFTDVLLTKGVKKVYAVDVGYGQFDWRLRNSEKVILIERTNARNISHKIIKEKIDIIVCDVSFISLKMVLNPSLKLLKNNFTIIALIKPQFEVEKKKIGKGGIIKSPEIHQEVCTDIENWAKQNINYKSIKIIDSPILGQKGNKEFFIYIQN